MSWPPGTPGKKGFWNSERRVMIRNWIRKEKAKDPNFYNYNVVNIDNVNISLKHYKGKLTLVVNMGRYDKQVE